MKYNTKMCITHSFTLLVHHLSFSISLYFGPLIQFDIVLLDLSCLVGMGTCDVWTGFLQLIKNIKCFTQFGYPLLVGVSYKSYIGDVLNQSVEKRSAASLASAIYCMQHGANIIRVHEVEQTKQAFAILDCITKS